MATGPLATWSSAGYSDNFTSASAGMAVEIINEEPTKEAVFDAKLDDVPIELWSKKPEEGDGLTRAQDTRLDDRVSRLFIPQCVLI